jgi:hypothetical protein
LREKLPADWPRGRRASASPDYFKSSSGETAGMTSSPNIRRKTHTNHGRACHILCSFRNQPSRLIFPVSSVPVTNQTRRRPPGRVQATRLRELSPWRKRPPAAGLVGPRDCR